MDSPGLLHQVTESLFRLVPRELLFDQKFKIVQNIIRDTELFPYGKLSELQFEKLEHIPQHAYTNELYYNRLFCESGINVWICRNL